MQSRSWARAIYDVFDPVSCHLLQNIPHPACEKEQIPHPAKNIFYIPHPASQQIYFLSYPHQDGRESSPQPSESVLAYPSAW